MQYVNTKEIIKEGALNIGYSVLAFVANKCQIKDQRPGVPLYVLPSTMISPVSPKLTILSP